MTPYEEPLLGVIGLLRFYGFRVQALGFRVHGSFRGYRVSGLEFKVQSLGFEVLFPEAPFRVLNDHSRVFGFGV